MTLNENDKRLLESLWNRNLAIADNMICYSHYYAIKIVEKLLEQDLIVTIKRGLVPKERVIRKNHETAWIISAKPNMTDF